MNWLNNNMNLDTPVLLQNSYRNLDNPLEYIKDDKVLELSNQLENRRQELKEDKSNVS